MSAVAASVTRLHRVTHAVAVDPVALASALGRAGTRDRLERMARALELEGAAWEAELFRGVLAARSDEARAAAVNEQLADVAWALDWGARIPVGAARASLAGALCAMFAVMAHDGPTASLVLTTLAWGGGGAVASIAAGREADRLAKRGREGIDALVERALAAAVSGVDSERPGV